MMAPREEWKLPTRRLGRRVLVFDRVDSTNTLAAAGASDPALAGAAFLADEQTAGHGQHGRTWLAEPRSSVLLSLLLFPPPSLLRPAVLTAWAAVSVCAAVQQLTGRHARIKWPNDVLLDGRKVCGILIEQAKGTVVGIGLNVRQTAEQFAAAGLPDAASLSQFSAEPLDTYPVAQALIQHLDREYDTLCRGEVGMLEASWRRHLGLLGREVTVECHGGVYDGRLSELSFAGVVLECREGPLTLPPEKILHLRPTEPSASIPSTRCPMR
jgi:BirA family biotin operon repressor/biotin-[acetyl-CoA-carboxylase] ligase